MRIAGADVGVLDSGVKGWGGGGGVDLTIMPVFSRIFYHENEIIWTPMGVRLNPTNLL